MSIESLRDAVTPPIAPQFSGTESEWRVVHDAIGITFPRDYCDLISLYGAGSFGGFLFVLDPFFACHGYSYTQHTKDILDAYVELRRIAPEKLPHSAFCDGVGLYPWLTSDNGDVGYWLVSSSSPETWPTILYDSRHSQYEKHQLSCSQFLSAWIGGELKTRFLQPPLSTSFVEVSATK
jgi:hypothetical protein